MARDGKSALEKPDDYPREINEINESQNATNVHRSRLADERGSVRTKLPERFALNYE